MVDIVVGHLQAGKVRGLESGGGSGSMFFVVCVGGSAGPGVCNSALRKVYFCSGRTLVGGIYSWWR